MGRDLVTKAAINFSFNCSRSSFWIDNTRQDFEGMEEILWTDNFRNTFLKAVPEF